MILTLKKYGFDYYLFFVRVWFASLLSNKVMWAGRQFKVIRGGVMREVKS